MQQNSQVRAVGAVMCFELLFPESVAELVRNGAQTLVWLTNDEDAKGGHYAYQFAQFARLRALENGRDLVRVNTDGADFAVSASGAMTPLSARQSGGFASYTLDWHTGLTFYTRYPRWVPGMCLLLLLGLAVMGARARLLTNVMTHHPQGCFIGEGKNDQKTT
jgi:apolipoprotein N-acyltransferase